MKNLPMLLIVGVGGYLLWNWYSSQSTSAIASTTPIGGNAPPLPPGAVTGTPTATPNPQPAPLPTPVTPPAPQSAWAQAIQVMKAQAGTNSLNWDQWSYYWQNSPTVSGAPFGFGVPGSISGTMFGTIVGTADHTANTSAEQFVANMQQAISALGLGGYMARLVPRRRMA